jgi:tetratricopeptide (TPR) repeat protein
VAKKIAAALKAEFSLEEKARIEKKPTGDLAAYDYYLKGREYYYRYNKTDNEHAIELFERALSLDPEYALAYAGIADAYCQRVGRFGFAESWADSAIALAEKAISVDPNLAEGHKALGLAYADKGWVQKSLEAYKRAVELNPNYHPAVSNLGYMYSLLGETVEAFRWRKKSMALNPTNPVTSKSIGAIYLEQVGDYAKAEQWFRRTLEIEPDYTSAKTALSLVYLKQGEQSRAWEQIEKVRSENPDDVWALYTAAEVAFFSGRDAEAKAYFEKLQELTPGSLFDRYANTRVGYLLWKAGENVEAGERLRQSFDLLTGLLEQGDENWQTYYDIAGVQAVQGEEAEACEWLQSAIDAGFLDLQWASTDPLLENLHDEECFEEMMTQLRAKRAEIRRQIEALE